MSDTQRRLVEAMLEDRGVVLPRERIDAAIATHEKLRHEFEHLRSVHLDFTPPYIEPATSVRWIEHYGREEGARAAR
jgi:hypothetical protein